MHPSEVAMIYPNKHAIRINPEADFCPVIFGGKNGVLRCAQEVGEDPVASCA